VTFLDLPLWLQTALVLEALAVAWLTWRFSWRGLVWGLVGAAAFWFLFGLAASYLVGRLEGGRAAELSGLVPGAGLATLRLAQVAAPVVALGAALGLVLRRLSPRKPKAG
jgi:hypothetical protein